MNTTMPEYGSTMMDVRNSASKWASEYQRCMSEYRQTQRSLDDLLSTHADSAPQVLLLRRHAAHLISSADMALDQLAMLHARFNDLRRKVRFSD